MGTIEERAKQICVDTFCSMCPKRVYTTCIWRHNTERSQPKCGISEYRGLIKDAYHAAIVQLQEQHEELTCWHDIETDKDGFATSKSLDAIFDKIPCLVKDSRSGEIELIDYDNASEWRGDMERKPTRYRWREIHE